MLASGRPPGAVVKDGGIRITDKGRLPFHPVFHPLGLSAKQQQKVDARIVLNRKRMHRDAEQRAGLSRKKETGVRYLGSTPLTMQRALEKETGDQGLFHGSEVEKTLKKIGCHVDQD